MSYVLLLIQEVISSHGGAIYKQPIRPNTDYFLVAEVKFGAVELRLENQGKWETLSFKVYTMHR